jgi:hypothetical protein
MAQHPLLACPASVSSLWPEPVATRPWPPLPPAHLPSNRWPNKPSKTTVSWPSSSTSRPACSAPTSSRPTSPRRPVHTGPRGPASCARQHPNPRSRATRLPDAAVAACAPRPRPQRPTHLPMLATRSRYGRRGASPSMPRSPNRHLL